MGFYDGIEKETAAGDLGAFVRAGHYLALVQRIRSGQTREGKHDFVAIDMRILHVFEIDSDTPKIIDPTTGVVTDWIDDPKGLHQAGEEVSVQFNGKFDSAKRNYKAFIANAVGVSTDEVTPAFCSQVEEDELLSGEVVELSNRMIETRAKKPFTKVWAVRPVPASEYSEVIDEEIAGMYFPEGFEELIADEDE